MSAPEWNAEKYHRVSEPQWNWGLKVLAELPLQGNETVLDAGCGTGRLTAVLLERLPLGRVVALDVSKSMLEVARRELARFGERVAFIHGDLSALGLHHMCDVVFSTATFHWVLEHEAMVRGLFAALRPGGRLHAQCGGAGNLTAFLALADRVSQRPEFARHFTGFRYPAHFAGAEETATLLRAAGFEDVKTWLTPAPTTFGSPEEFGAFVSTVVLRHAYGVLPAELHESFTRQIVAEAVQAPTPLTLDYVRLELRARKP